MIESIQITFDKETKQILKDLTTSVNTLEAILKKVYQTQDETQTPQNETQEPTKAEQIDQPETSSNKPKTSSKKSAKAKQKEEPNEEQNEELKAADITTEETPIQLFEVIKLINEYAKKTSVDDAKKFVATFGVRATKDMNQEQLNKAHAELMKKLEALK
jgi:hypothetical protein